MREFEIGAGMKAAEVSPDILAAVNAHALEPMDSGDLMVRRMDLAHDQYDRTLERFPKSYLQRFAETLPGKSVLAAHDTRQLPVGKWFDAKVTSRTQDQPIFVQPGSGKAFTEPVPGFEIQRQRVQLLDAGFYYPTTDARGQELDTWIKAGIYNSGSIGFRFADLNCDVCKTSYWNSNCPHIIGYPLDWSWDNRGATGDLVTGTYSGTPEQIQREAEALEGSLVYLGAQPNARIRKHLMVAAKQVDVRALAMTAFGEIDPVAHKEAEALARAFGHKQKSWAFPGLAQGKDQSQAPYYRAATDVAEQCVTCTHFNAGTGRCLLFDFVADPAYTCDAFDCMDEGGMGGMAEMSAEETDAMNLARLRKAFGLKDDAPEEDALKAAETAVAEKTAADAAKAEAEQKATTAEAKVTDLTGKLEKAEPLAEVGKSALTALKQEILDHDYALTGKKENLELSGLLDTYVEGKNFAKLAELAGEKRQARSDKYGGKLSGTPDGGEEQDGAAQRRHPRETQAYRF